MQKVPVSILRELSDAKLPGPLHSRFWRDIDAIRRRHAYLREIVEQANCVISLSEFQKEMYVRNGYDEHKIRIIHHGVETDGLKPASRLPTDPLELVFIGSLVYNKGAHVLVNALGRRPSAKVRLLIYGDDSGSNSYLESLKRLAASDERVQLMGTFPTSEMGRVLETAHALAVPALWYENEPLVVKAAQYIGLPVLASNIGTLATSIQSGVNGWLIPPGDVEAWAGAIESLNPAPFHPDSSIKSIDENACELFGIYEDIYSRHRCSAQNT
jgi:glycosyltransferase involved in cell wall biosynthesis